MGSEIVAPAGYGDFLHEVKSQIRQRQFQALRAANKELLALYWWLGENISRRQAELGWGKSVVETLAQDLQTEFPGRNGFSARNLWNMLDFYRDYADRPKLQPLVAEISWAKNLLIMARCKDDLEREFYLRATARFGWTSKGTMMYERIARGTGEFMNKQLFPSATNRSLSPPTLSNRQKPPYGERVGVRGEAHVVVGSPLTPALSPYEFSGVINRFGRGEGAELRGFESGLPNETIEKHLAGLVYVC